MMKSIYIAAPAAALATALLMQPVPARADFYRYLSEDGVETFTNTPTQPRAVKIMREGKKAKPKPEPAESAAVEGDPVLPVKGNITSGYGWRHDPIDGGIRHHSGVDIAVPSGTPVKAIAGGKVVFSGARGGYGNLVVIDHGDGTQSLYGHNSELNVHVGEKVAAGEVVALSGSTGRSTGPHLHFELWKNGANMTEAYLKNGSGVPEVAMTGSIRSYIHKDGSLVFTNIH
ncbi:M23 family metallopeptidase [Geomesophilobacter sediminis]|uniref:M23 family metallopeptidase n=1 Tax=Geomesophilobacter sediminis TaxID=2798584 RepID=A0A8J7J4J9_9BACT|nr:M23 family metallopeptidase [Geomesophilobacter sediminis]MBJ6723086.1 M23 family metallopeptidase [Geomesophilobacter sediminis]